jgi:hypothetical protein
MCVHNSKPSPFRSKGKKSEHFTEVTYRGASKPAPQFGSETRISKEVDKRRLEASHMRFLKLLIAGHPKRLIVRGGSKEQIKDRKYCERYTELLVKLETC